MVIHKKCAAVYSDQLVGRDPPKRPLEGMWAGSAEPKLSQLSIQPSWIPGLAVGIADKRTVPLQNEGGRRVDGSHENIGIRIAFAVLCLLNCRVKIIEHRSTRDQSRRKERKINRTPNIHTPKMRK